MDLRICMVSSYFYPMGYGGNAVVELCRNLRKSGIKVHVITSRGPCSSEHQFLDGVHVHRIPTIFLKFLNTEYPVSPTTTRALVKTIGNYDIDLIHAHFELFQMTLACSFAKYMVARPMVLTMHGQGVTNGSSYGSSTLDLMWLANHSTVERFVIRSANRIIALTDSIKLKALSLGGESEKIRIIPNGVDTERFKPLEPDEETRAKLNIHSRNKVLVFCGRLHPAHGVVQLLQAIRRVVALHPNVVVVLVGDGPLRHYTTKFIRSNKLGKFVRVLGFQEDIPKLLNIAHLVIYPALSVGMPLSVLEAMACGKAVVAFDIEGNRALIDDGKTGFLVKSPTADALVSQISSLLYNLDCAAEVGSNARKHVENSFTWDKVAKEVIKVYEDLVVVHDETGN